MPEGERTVCATCFHRCALAEGQTGRCRARKNVGGEIRCINYARVTSLSLDPVEKKPLARFYPGSLILSAGSFGCNLDCPFCQNDSISCASETTASWRMVEPRQLAETAYSLRDRGNIGAAFTYNEPMIGWEYVRDAAAEVKKLGMKNVVVTNGTASPEALGEVLPYIDAFNIDLKGFTEAWYKKLGGNLAEVEEFIRLAAKKSHVEITTLVVPGENDSPEEMGELSAFVASVDRAIPLHITRFFPRRKMLDTPPTDVGVMRTLAEEASKRLDTVLLGNI